MRSYDGPPTGLPGFRFAGHTPEHGRTKSMIAQQLAYMMLIQALRLYLADATTAGRGWLSALSDKHMSIAITSMHRDPGYPWTLHLLAERVGMSRSVFALRFREIVGVTPMEYLTRWRMLSGCRPSEELR